MSTKSQATVADLYAVSAKAELVNGEIVLMSPTGDDPSEAALEIMFSLRTYAKQTGVGVAKGGNVGFLCNLPGRQSFSPDAAYYTGPRSGMRYLPEPPVFAVEVRSEGDYGPAQERALAVKRDDYFAAGTLVVWDVDLLSTDVVRVYRATDPAHPTIYRRGDLAEAEPAVPGWTLPVDHLFQVGN
jgi:Uma2 family endonuclease